jgi:hypothetical protein
VVRRTVTQNGPEILDLDRQAADEIVRRLEASNLPEPDRQIIRGLFASYLYVVQLLQLKRISIARLKKFIFGGRGRAISLRTFGAPTGFLSGLPGRSQAALGLLC